MNVNEFGEPVPRSMGEFWAERYEIADFSQKHIISDHQHVAIVAPPKSGKREMIEYAALSSIRPDGSVSAKHIFVTSLTRRDTKVQEVEMNLYKIDWMRTNSHGVTASQIAKIKRHLDESDVDVYLHFDESDYGTGFKQCLGVFYSGMKVLVQHYGKRIKFRYYSATNEELTYANTGFYVHIKTFTPPPTYKGPDWFLDKNLVYDAEPFFDQKGLTAHGFEVVQLWKKDFAANQDKLFAILRNIGGKRGIAKLKDNKKAKNQLARLGVVLVFIDSANPFGEWSNEKPRSYYPKLTLLVVDSTFTRSTEMKFHKYVSFLHDYRSPNAAYNTVAQAALRVNHYDPVGHEIRVYSNPIMFEVACGRKPMSELNRNLSQRMTKQRTFDTPFRLHVEDATLENLKKFEHMAQVHEASLGRFNECNMRNMLRNISSEIFNQTLENFFKILDAQDRGQFSNVMDYTGKLVSDTNYPIKNFSDRNLHDGIKFKLKPKGRAFLKRLKREYPDFVDKIVYLQQLSIKPVVTYEHETTLKSMFPERNIPISSLACGSDLVN